ncbi:MAG: hypothetical protein IPP71_01865 [Bacteroidetes bacterium]|nr:hypothetical protein [Bacteroidota bacterium]
MGSGTRMACINNPNDPTTATFSDPAPGLSNLSTSITTTLGYGGATEPLVVFPDQIDGEIYGYSLLPNAVGIGLSSSVACTGQYISLTSNSGFSSYLWNTSQTTQNITVTNSGVYTVVVTDANGCQAKSSVEVSIIDCCTGTVGTLTGNFFSSQLSGFSFYSTLPPRIESGFNGVPAASGPSVALNGTLTIDQPDFEFRDLELTMGENSKIILAPGSTKTLNFENNNYIHGCNDNMWDGIYIEYAQGTLEASDGNTFIEDAKNAIVSNDFGNFQLENVHFNRNWKDLVINLKNASVAHPGRVFNGCKFTCGPLYISADALCYSPHLGAITNVGIEINGPGVVQVGNPSFADNEFDNIRRGIATNNVKKGRIEACNFQNITDAGIYSYNSKLLILGNDFLTSRTGILSTTSSSSMFFGHIITGNTFTDVLYHISDWAGKYHYIGPGYGYGKNFFGDINSDPNDNIAGTYFLGTSGFTMMDNEFYRSKYGSVVLNSGPYGRQLIIRMRVISIKTAITQFWEEQIIQSYLFIVIILIPV